jgi:hypothetical protein
MWRWLVPAVLALTAAVAAVAAISSGRSAQGSLFIGHAVVLSAIAWSFRSTRASAVEPGHGAQDRRSRRLAPILATGAIVVPVSIGVLGVLDGRPALTLVMALLTITWVLVAVRLWRR